MAGPVILLFVEDPGAALFLRGLPAALAECGFECHVMASDHAAPYFAGIAVLPVPEGQSAPENSTTADLTGEDLAGQALDHLGASLLIVGTSENLDSFAFALISAARKRLLPVVGAVDAGANADRRFSGRTTNALAHGPDWLIVPDEDVADIFAALGFARDHIAVSGHPRIDEIAILSKTWSTEDPASGRRRFFPDAPINRPVILFVSELSTGLGEGRYQRSEAYCLAGTRGSDARTDIVIDEFILQARQLVPAPWLVLRLHPKQALAAESHNIALFDQISKTETGLEIAFAADLIVGMTSILMVEAAALGLPVLSIVPKPDEQAWLGESGRLIHCVWQREAIADWLHQRDGVGADGRYWPETSVPRRAIPALTVMTQTIANLSGINRAGSKLSGGV